MILMMRTTNIRFSLLRKSTMRSSIVIVSLIGLLTSCWGATPQGPAPVPANNQRASVASMRIMPADGAAFLVEQRFDIRVEAPAGVSGPLHVSLDGRDIGVAFAGIGAKDSDKSEVLVPQGFLPGLLSPGQRHVSRYYELPR